MDSILRLESVTKRFGQVLAVDGVSLEAGAGEVHALLGENGAGKSTLMSILAGRYRPDGGRILVRGRELSFSSPAEALAAGIGMVYQRFSLVENLTVAENIALADPAGGLSLDLAATARELSELASRYGFPVDPDRPVRELSMGERQRVEILRLLRRRADILIFDEPTSILTPIEVETFLDTMRALRQEGKALIFITHKLDEAMELADRISVMRRGRLVAALLPSQVRSRRSLARLMVGREVIFHVDKDEAPASARRDTVLSAVGLAGRDGRGRTVFEGVNLEVRRGEIVALAGVAGNGQSELATALAGLFPLEQGTVRFLGRMYKASEWAGRERLGLAYIPEDRHGVGSVPDLSLVENFMLTTYRDKDLGRGIFLDRAEAGRRTGEAIENFSIRAPGPEAPVRQLSGGNLQKLILARELGRRPDLLIAQQPTQGLDVAATEDVWQALLAARQNAGVLLVTTDLKEALTLADRIAVMFRGRILDVLSTADEDGLERISTLMAGVTEHSHG